MLGVWQGVPYIFADFVEQYIQRPDSPSVVNTRSRAYRGYLLYIAFPPMLLLLAVKPVWLVVIYAITGAFFMPLLASLLLYMNNRSIWVGHLRNGALANLALLVSLLVFGLLLVEELSKYA
jgi:RsiW-degrading membrane proteinase PrsW (M82 family)